MRVQTAPDPGSATDLAVLSEFLLQIGEGRYPEKEDIGEGDICLPHDMCVFPEPLEVPPVPNEPRDEDADRVSDSSEDDETEPFPNFKLLPSVDDHNSRDLDLLVHDAAPDSDNVPPEVDDTDDDRRTRNVNALIDAVYPGINADDLPNEYFVERAILAPTNASVRRINEMVAARLTGETKEYLSTDSLEGVADSNLFEQEFLNSLNFSGIPPHKFVWKVGTPIIMIRNLSSDAGLCNGTRLRVVSVRERSIEATVMSGPSKGNAVFIPRIVFYTEDDDKEFTFKLKRKQFPVVPAFAMTINKAQGQSIHHVGIYLESPVFAHGQLDIFDHEVD
ncbi:Helitron helicase [Phytophthora megakarya]|uniref:Helitron helicase n=1 Tax=Phytophthora megakarya TaxID=4795 RepID=A0A225VVY6_9STRA|nr:Helitron helicase [Phytophthora megakarya]